MNRKTLFLFVVSFFFFSAGFAQQRHTFSLGTDDFLLDGKPFQIISGEVHPARIPREYWRHRVQMVKAMGCNTVSAYMFWNHHEVSPGIFDFKTGNRDIAEFIRICQEEGMWVIIRPGPYVCAEWDFGGLPTYLLKIPDIKVRGMDARYMEPVRHYVANMAEQIAPLQITNGGPLLMIQVENEYGSYGNDKEYLLTLRDMWVRNDINVPFFTGDGPTAYMLDAGTIPGAAIGLDSGSNERDFEQGKKQNPNVPVFSSETYPGWLTHWGEKWAKPDTNSLKKEIEFLLKNKKSFNFYVIHGGTNFGFTAGANASSPVSYQPDLTSYDYDAPIDEQGRATPKYHMLRNLIKQYVSYKVPEIPAPIPVITIPAIQMKKAWNLWNYSLPSINTVQPQPFENFDQNQGLAIYKTKLIGHKSGRLKIWEPHDYALVFLNGQFIDTVYRDGGRWEVTLPKTDVDTPLLEIVVEGMGHINFAQFMIDRKGITDRVTLNGMTLMNWETTLLPLDEEFMRTQKPDMNEKVAADKPCNFFTGSFNLTEVGDTYFDMSKFTKGVVYVNGHNLGRFWNIGPQQRLYCPASWLKKGKNEIIAFDLHQMQEATIEGVTDLGDD
ncbi:MAG: beta-galactosidase [Chitinophagaceae bacterium]|nr:beta-galactosidase [Chitinophagaceae bacterium]